MRPECIVTINGRPASDLFTRRLRSCTVTDKEGVSSDTVEIVLNDDPPGEIPPPAARIGVQMGYAGRLAPMGEFIVQEVDLGLLPYSMRVTGKAAAFGQSASQRERHWDDVTLGDLVRQIAGENGLGASVDPDLGAFTYPWIGQIDESDVAFLERLAQRHNALFSVKRGVAIFARRGGGVTPGGAALTGISLTPSVLRTGGASVRRTERRKYERVIASWQDRAGGQRREVSAVVEEDGEGQHVIDQPFATEAEARSAAEARAKEFRRGALTFRADCLGDPTYRAGAPLAFRGVRPWVDDQSWIVETATHSFDASGGYTTSLDGKLRA